ncbi:MAG: intracellular sulfur oxidation DsrE/DsrF family protein [Granulosicoccus sp.]|jgi:intracellular sulfur oxidation DsrE/DsrF family protein
MSITKFITFSLVSLLLIASATTAVHSADPVHHKVAIHVDENDPARMNMALNNVVNVQKYYESIGDTVEIELVAYGPGLHMFRSDTSPVKERISFMALELDNLTFSACGNTHAAMSKKSGKEIVLIDEANMVPSGVVQLIALQEQGYAYIRP